MRFVLAMMQHETNTFSPVPTPLGAFGRGARAGAGRGEAAVAGFVGTRTAMAAFHDLALAEGAEIVVPVAASAAPSGPVEDAAFDTISGWICEAVAAGADAAFLHLHGAMVTETHDDGEGELLRRIRALAPDLPIAVALDFHTNLTAAMVDNATVIAGYCTYPHIDIYETGRRAGATLIRALNGEVEPVMAWRALPMITHMLRQTPAEQPMKDIMDLAIRAEAEGKVLAASIFGGFPLADIPHVSLSSVVVTDGADAAGGALLDRLLAMAWQRRADFVFPVEPMAHSIGRAKQLPGRPILLADHGDNCGAGGNQDVMAVLAEVIAQGLEDVAVGPIHDPESVARMIEAGVGADVTLRLGGKTDMPAIGLTGEPLAISGRVRRITDGRYRVTGPMSTGIMLNMGRTAVLDTATLEIVVIEGRDEPFDIGCFTHAGIDPAAKKFLLIKSRQHFRAGFEPIVADIVMVAGPGVCTSNYDMLAFKNLTRPIYPLDPDMRP